MAADFVAVGGALAGVALGHLLSYFTTRSATDREWQLSLARDEITSRQRLYAEFLAEAQEVVMRSMSEKSSDLRLLTAVNARFAEITLLSPDAVIERAKLVIDHALMCHSKEGPKQDSNFWVLKSEFIKAAKEEIGSLRRIRD